METILRKYLLVLDLLVVALCATLLARAGASWVESKFFMMPAPARLGARELGVPAEAVYGKQINRILERNVFCSTCPPIIEQTDEVARSTALRVPQKTTLPLALIAIMYAPPPHAITWSVAILRDTELKSAGPYGVGMSIHDATVIEIKETRIYLDNAGKKEFLDLLEGAAGSSPATFASVAPRSAFPTDPLTEEMAQGIKQVGEHSYEIRRSTLESVLGNMNLLSRSARIVPEIRDGKAAGFRLYNVRSEGPFAKIGMRDGDVISAINGLEITSPEKALEVYAKLKSASHLSVGLERNGQRIANEYSIR